MLVEFSGQLKPPSVLESVFGAVVARIELWYTRSRTAGRGLGCCRLPSAVCRRCYTHGRIALLPLAVLSNVFLNCPVVAVRSIFSDCGNRRVRCSGGKDHNRRLHPIFRPHHVAYLPSGERRSRLTCGVPAGMVYLSLVTLSSFGPRIKAVSRHIHSASAWQRLCRSCSLSSWRIGAPSVFAAMFCTEWKHNIVSTFLRCRWCTGPGVQEDGQAPTGVRTRPQQRSTSYAGTSLGRSCWGAGLRISLEPEPCT